MVPRDQKLNSHFRRITNTRGDSELKRRSPNLWGPGTKILLLIPLYYLDLYTTKIYLRYISLALVHVGEAELGLLVFILMDGRRTPTPTTPGLSGAERDTKPNLNSYMSQTQTIQSVLP